MHKASTTTNGKTGSTGDVILLRPGTNSDKQAMDNESSEMLSRN
jgi:hypothetical protein